MGGVGGVAGGGGQLGGWAELRGGVMELRGRAGHQDIRLGDRARTEQLGSCSALPEATVE